METGFWIFLTVCLLALSADVIDWVCDKIEEKWQK